MFTDILLSAVGSGSTPEPSTVNTVVNAMTDGLSSAGSDILGAIGSIVPVALPVMIGVVVIGVGIKIYKKVTGSSRS